MKKIRAFIKATVVLGYKIMVKLLPVSKNIVVFNSSMGMNYTGNPRYIYEKMVELGLDKKWKCIWFFENGTTKVPGNGNVVVYGRMKYLYYMAIAKAWVFDCRQPEFLIKRKQTCYIQTWHGTPLKKLAADMDDVFMVEGKDIEAYHQGFLNNAKSWDYLISQNPFSTTVFRRAFGFQKQMIESGYPRNDILFSHNNGATIQQLKQKLNLPLDKKVILYAPTWRDDEFYEQKKYKFNPKLDFHKMQEELSNEYVMIVKYHYLVQDAIDWSPYKGFIYQCDKSYDISWLYLVADQLITDYSSVMFDYSILKRPIFFFAYDLENYKNNLRGFYFDLLEEAPGPISLTTEQLIEQIKGYQQEEHQEKYSAFSKKYNPFDNGHASEQVIKILKGHIEQG